jgi:DNA-binding NarL/FixJ family response regulator
MGESQTIHVVIADDDDDIRTLVTDLLSDQPGVEVVGTAADTDGAIETISELKPEVAIIDWVMPGGGGGKATGEIKAVSPETKVIAFTGADANQASYDMMTHGAVGFVQKPCTREQLMEAITAAMRW